MNENTVKVVAVDNTGHTHAMRGILKLFTEVQVARASGSELHFDRKVFKRVTLATYYGVRSDYDLEGYRKTFIELNPAMKNCHINYEYVIREFG